METPSRESEPDRKTDSEGPTEKPTSPVEAGDLELIQHSLALRPEERLDVLQDFVDAFWTPRHG